MISAGHKCSIMAIIQTSLDGQHDPHGLLNVSIVTK